jgi:hypothetical protein
MFFHDVTDQSEPVVTDFPAQRAGSGFVLIAR